MFSYKYYLIYVLLLLDTAPAIELETYEKLQALVLSKGICIWDIYSQVHLPKTSPKRTKRPKLEISDRNDLSSLLKEYPSIKTIGFIGQKAHDGLKRIVKNSESNCDHIKKLDWVVLSSSSPSNTRMNVKEKAVDWKCKLWNGISY